MIVFMKNHLLKLSFFVSILALLTSCGETILKDQPAKKISVTGSAEMEIVPDEIYVNFTLREYMDGSKPKINLEDLVAYSNTNTQIMKKRITYNEK